MELTSFQRVNVSLIEKKRQHITVAVKCDEINNTVGAEDLQIQLYKSIGLPKVAHQYFTLVKGCERPVQKFKISEKIPYPVTDICLQKWCFDVNTENRELLADLTSQHLVFLQAQLYIETGKLKPSDEVLHQLEECLDPEFLAENQYISICQGLPHYTSTMFKDCQFCQDFNWRHFKIGKDSICTLFVTRNGVEVHSDDHILHISWNQIKSWTESVVEEMLCFQVCFTDGSLNALVIKTNQCAYLSSVIQEYVKILQSKSPEQLTYYTSMITRLDSGATRWENSLYSPSDPPAPPVTTDAVCL